MRRASPDRSRDSSGRAIVPRLRQCVRARERSLRWSPRSDDGGMVRSTEHVACPPMLLIRTGRRRQACRRTPEFSHRHRRHAFENGYRPTPTASFLVSHPSFRQGCAPGVPWLYSARHRRTRDQSNLPGAAPSVAIGNERNRQRVGSRRVSPIGSRARAALQHAGRQTPYSAISLHRSREPPQSFRLSQGRWTERIVHRTG